MSGSGGGSTGTGQQHRYAPISWTGCMGESTARWQKSWGYGDGVTDRGVVSLLSRSGGATGTHAIRCRARFTSSEPYSTHAATAAPAVGAAAATTPDRRLAQSANAGWQLGGGGDWPTVIFGGDRRSVAIGQAVVGADARAVVAADAARTADAARYAEAAHPWRPIGSIDSEAEAEKNRKREGQCMQGKKSRPQKRGRDRAR